MWAERRTARATTRVAFLAALTTILPACRPAAGADVVTLRFWALGREGEVVQQLLPDFERLNPGIRVRVQQIPWTAAHEKLLTAYVGDATPDVSQLGNTWVAELQALGALADLTPYVARSPVVAEGAYFPGIWDTNVIDGAPYGIPWYVDTRVMFYRTDLLAKAGYASFPTTWATWLDAMRRVKRAGGANRYAILLPTNEWPPPVILALQMHAPLLRDHDQYGWFDEPRFKAAFEFYVDLFRSGLAPAISNVQVANLYEQFAGGDFAMYITGPWNIGEFSRRLPATMQDKWMTAPLPSPDSITPGVSLAGGSSLVIYRSSAHKAEAWKLIEYLSAPEQQLRFSRLTGDLPASRTAWQDTSLIGNTYARAFYQQLERVSPTPKIPEWEQIATKVMDYVEAAVRGKMTTDQAIGALNRDVDGILAKRRWLLARRTGG